MPIGITNNSIVTMQNLTDIFNITNDPTEFFINVNHIVYGGWYWFIILLTLWVILYLATQQVKDQALINFMYGGLIVTVISFIMRAIYVVKNGVVWGMINDTQLWLFPIVTILCAVFLWATKSAYNT